MNFSLLDAVALMLKVLKNCHALIVVLAWWFAMDMYAKQRFLCKNGGRTFVPTTNTIMANFLFPTPVWKEMIANTLHGNAIDNSVRSLGLYHQAAYDTSHKILLVLQELPEVTDICLGEVSESDETLVLNCYNGRPIDVATGRNLRKHGAKRKGRAFPMNTCVSVPASGARGKRMRPLSIA